MRILILTTTPQTIQAFFGNQVSALRTAGLDVYVGSNISRGTPIPFVEWDHQLRIPFSRSIAPLADLRALLAICSAIRKIRPDIVHCYTPKAGLLGMIAAAVCGTKIRIYTLLGFPAETARYVRRWLLIKSEKLACQLASRVYSASESLRAVAIQAKIASAEQLHVLQGAGFGVDIEHFRRDSAAHSARLKWRQHFGLSPRHVVVGFVGRLAKDKGLDVLASSWRKVISRCPNARLVVHGIPETREPVEQWVMESLRDLPNAVISGVFVPEIRELYSVFDVFVLPSRREGLPTVLLEASSMSLPSIATTATGCVDVISHSKTGLLVNIDDATQLADAIVCLVEDADLRERLGAAARTVMARIFDSRMVCRVLVAEYNAIIREQRMEMS